MKPKVIMVMVASLDGYTTKHVDGFIDWASPEDTAFFKKTIQDAGVIIHGRKTQETIKRPMPGKVNIVMTHTPKKFKSEPGVVEYTKESPQELIARLTKQGHKKIIVSGPEINLLFLKENLIDELYLTIEPLLFGSGNRLFADSKLEQKLQLIESKQLNTNTVLLHYKFIK